MLFEKRFLIYRVMAVLHCRRFCADSIEANADNNLYKKMKRP